MGWRDSARVRKLKRIWKTEGSRIRHQRKSQAERRWWVPDSGPSRASGTPNAECQHMDGMSTQRPIQNSDIHWVHPVPRMH